MDGWMYGWVGGPWLITIMDHNQSIINQKKYLNSWWAANCLGLSWLGVFIRIPQYCLEVPSLFPWMSLQLPLPVMYNQ